MRFRCCHQCRCFKVIGELGRERISDASAERTRRISLDKSHNTCTIEKYQISALFSDLSNIYMGIVYLLDQHKPAVDASTMRFYTEFRCLRHRMCYIIIFPIPLSALASWRFLPHCTVLLINMASFRLRGFQSALRGHTGLLRNQQRRWAQVHDVRFLASHHDPKHVLDKYRSKLDEKAKQ